ncbi:hypothetical protein KKH36_00400 [Patescibacteria group bacterium]|nr:hypothetical protein [Patescibacteria group bacterium]
METSFIPKKNYAKATSNKNYVGLFLTIASFIFVLSIVSSIGVFFYKSFLEGEIENKNIILEKEKGNLDLTLIQELSQFDKRMEAAKDILNKHISLVHLFSFLEENTLKEVMYSNLSFEKSKEGYLLTLDGKASSYAAVAIQSDIFGRHKDIKEPIFSDLGVNSEGDIIFSVVMKLDPRLISFKDNLVEVE